MATKKTYVCSNCQKKSAFPIGICPNCNARDSYKVVTESAKTEPKHITVAAPAGAKASSVKHISKIDSSVLTTPSATDLMSLGQQSPIMCSIG